MLNEKLTFWKEFRFIIRDCKGDFQMKTFPITPSKTILELIMGKSFNAEMVPVSEEPDKCLSPVEIRRFVRQTRQNRDYNYSRDFVY